MNRNSARDAKSFSGDISMRHVYEQCSWTFFHACSPLETFQEMVKVEKMFLATIPTNNASRRCLCLQPS